MDIDKAIEELERRLAESSDTFARMRVESLRASRLWASMHKARWARWFAKRAKEQGGDDTRFANIRTQLFEPFTATIDTERQDDRPHCEKWVNGPAATEQCGSERGLKRIKYDTGSNRVYCPEHFDKEWADSSASEAEPIKTAKDDK